MLVVADDPATVDLAAATFVADRAGSAGHRIVAQEIVEAREGAIRDQLSRWISQPHIDVIIGTGAGEAAIAALGPLVTSPLQGMTDQLRLLSRDRGGEGKPAAARCGAKFVFLLPAEIPALGPALNQLVLPQLDSTQPRHLVGEMPRHQGVPRELPSEKTASGAGLVPKLPAQREKRKTANVIARSELADPTKQTVIDAKVGDTTAQTPLKDITKQTPIAPAGRRTSTANDAPTRPHIDIASMLPPVPPGADIDTDEQPALVEPPLTVQPRARVHPSSNDKTVIRPTPSDDGKTAVRAAPTRPASQTNRGVQPTPALGTGVARGPIGVAMSVQTAPPAIVPPKSGPTAPPAVVPAIPSIGRPQTPSGGTPVKTPPAGVATVPTPLPSLKTPPGVAKQSPPAADKPTPPAADRQTPPVVAKPTPPAVAKQAPAAPAKPISLDKLAALEKQPPANGTPRLPAPTPISGVKSATAAGAKGLDVVDTAALSAAAAADETVEPDEIEALSSANILEAVPADVKASFETHTPPPVPPRAAARAPARPAVPPETKPIDAATAEAKLAKAAASRPPVTKLQDVDLPKPELLDLSEGVAKNRRSRTGTALVRRRTSSTVLLYFALACAAVAGFVAVVHFFPQGKAEEPPPPRGSNVVAVAPVVVADAAEAVPVATGSGSGSDSAEIEIEPGSAAATPPEPPPTHPATHPSAHVTTPPTTRPTAKPETRPETKPETKPEPTPPPAEDGCDEVSCVLEKYQRECCARFKPKDGDAFHPKNATPDTLDKSMVYAGIEKVKPVVIACGEKSSAKGTVKIAMTVAPAGNITDASVADAPDPALGQCVLAAVKRAKFGASINGATFTFPFAF